MSAALLGALVAAALGSPPAGAPAGGARAVEVAGACPTADAVGAALRTALGEAAPPPGVATPRVTDLGSAFEVTARGQTQRYSDPGRDCAERARVAAVFITLALNPPNLPVREAPAPPPPPPAAPAETPAPIWTEIGAAGRLDGGATPGGGIGLAGGVELRWASGRRDWGVAAALGIMTPLDSEASSVNVRQQRFPASLSVTARRALSVPVVITGAAGVALVPITLRAQGIAASSPGTRLDAGARVACALALRVSPRLVPFVELAAAYFPRPFELTVDPLGRIGSTGRLWIGAAAGLSFALGAR